MRITMGMVSRQYNKNLNNSLNQLNEASNRNTTLRKFNKASEDPFSASKAYRLRCEFQQNYDYQSNLGDVEDQLTTANSAMQSINNIVSEASTGDCIKAITGTMSKEDRTTVATKLRALQKAIVAPANTKFGDKYIFGGSGTVKPPFTTGAAGNLLYRGIDVNTGKIEAGSTLSYNGTQITLGDKNFNGYKIQVTTANGVTPSVSADAASKTLTVNLATGAKNSDVLAALSANKTLTSTDGSTTFDLSKAAMSGDMNRPVDTTAQTATAIDTIGLDGLKALANEKCFVDLGMGLSLNTDGKTINEQSVFDTSIPGITFMGYGTVDGSGTGVSNNLYTLLGQVADQLESPNFSMDNIRPYLDNLGKQVQNSLNQVTKSGTKSNFLTTTKAQLESIGDNVDEKLNNTEYVDPMDAYLDYTWQQYTYQSSLKIGTQILQPTVLDFMR